MFDPLVFGCCIRLKSVNFVPTGAPFNVAFEKPALQSSTSGASRGEQASLAVDGDSTTDNNHGSCTVAGKLNKYVKKI